MWMLGREWEKTVPSHPVNPKQGVIVSEGIISLRPREQGGEISLAPLHPQRYDWGCSD